MLIDFIVHYSCFSAKNYKTSAIHERGVVFVSSGDFVMEYLSPCVTLPIASEKEVKLAVLPVYGEVEIREK